MRSLMIQRRKAPIFNRIFHARSFQQHLRSVAVSLPTPAPPPAGQDSPTSAVPASNHQPTELRDCDNDQSLRPLMDRLESHFRLQRQTMGVLAQLNDTDADASTTTTSTASGSVGNVDYPTSASHDHSGSNLTSYPWASNVIRNMRDWRSRRESTALERTRSLESAGRLAGPHASSGRFQMPRRVDTSIDLGVQTGYRTFPPLIDDDSSDTDNGKAIHS